MPDCKEGVSRPCGKACVSIKKRCKKTPDKYPLDGTQDNPICLDGAGDKSKKRKKVPTCKEGISRRCGKACVSIKKACKKNPDQYPLPETPADTERARRATKREKFIQLARKYKRLAAAQPRGVLKTNLLNGYRFAIQASLDPDVFCYEDAEREFNRYAERNPQEPPVEMTHPVQVFRRAGQDFGCI